MRCTDKKTRLAVLSDIHGNRRALQAVLDDMASLDLDDAIHLGDVAYGPLDPVGTIALLRRSGIPSVRGNEDRVLDPSDDSSLIANPLLAFSRQRLPSALRRRLGALPTTLQPAPGVLACHGTPTDDSAYLLWVPDGESLIRRTGTEIAAVLKRYDAHVVLCGHDHLAADMELPDGRRVIDPGSVGCPAYEDDAPVLHRMEAGSPHARYAILELEGDRVAVEFRRIAYDWRQAAAEAEANGYPGWAGRLLSGAC